MDKIFEGIHVLDGSLATELKKREVEINSKLWTAEALADNIEKIYDVHLDYLWSGAQMILTDTYQANLPAFEKEGYTKKQAETLIAVAVQAAKKARADYEEDTGNYALVAGSIGPYGAYLADGSEYRGDYLLSEAQYLDFHLPRLTTVLLQEPDCLALETQPKLSEPLAILKWLKQNVPFMPVYVSFTLKDEKTLSDGTPLAVAVQAVSEYDQVFAVGINCISPKLVEKALREIKQNTAKKIIVYPNSGATYDAKTKTWQDLDKKIDFEQEAAKWHQAGADLIGGCCTTGTKDIKAVANYFAKLQQN